MQFWISHPTRWLRARRFSWRHKTSEKHGVSQLFCLFAHLDLHFSDCLFCLFLFSDCSHYCCCVCPWVGSLPSKLPSTRLPRAFVYQDYPILIYIIYIALSLATLSCKHLLSPQISKLWSNRTSPSQTSERMKGLEDWRPIGSIILAFCAAVAEVKLLLMSDHPRHNVCWNRFFQISAGIWIWSSCRLLHQPSLLGSTSA